MRYSKFSSPKMCRNIAKSNIKVGYTRLTRFFALCKAPMMPEGHWYACTRGRLKILWHHKAANEDKPRFFRWQWSWHIWIENNFNLLQMPQLNSWFILGIEPLAKASLWNVTLRIPNRFYEVLENLSKNAVCICRPCFRLVRFLDSGCKR